MADPTLADYVMYHTGGGSNSDPALSIGGAISSARVLNQSAAGLSLITGVTIDDATGNAVGNGTLTYATSGQTLTWTPYGSSSGTAVAVGTNGKYFIQGGGTGAGGLAITVVAASLPGSNVSDTITIANQTEKMFKNLTKAETLAGVTKYHCFAVKNTHASMDLIAILEWIAANTPGQDNITIGLDPLAAGSGATGPTAIVNENTAPSGVTFVNPTSISDTNALAVGTLTYGQCRFIWFKQQVPANCTTSTTANTFNRGYSITA
jgi:hypothetical protein